VNHSLNSVDGAGIRSGFRRVLASLWFNTKRVNQINSEPSGSARFIRQLSTCASECVKGSTVSITPSDLLQDTERLSAIRRWNHLGLEAHAACTRAASMIARVLVLPYAYVMLVDHKHCSVLGAHGFELSDAKMSLPENLDFVLPQGFVQQSQPEALEHLADFLTCMLKHPVPTKPGHLAWTSNGSVAHAPIGFFAAVPLTTPDAQIVGCLVVLGGMPYQFGLEEAALLEDFAEGLSSELDARAELIALRQHESRATQRANTNLLAIIESTNEAIMSESLDGTVRSWNPAAQRLFGFTPAEIIGQPSERLIPAGPLRDEHREHLKTGRTIASFEGLRQDRDEQIIPVRMSIAPVIGPDGRVIGASSFISDLRRERAEILEREQALEVVNQQLQVVTLEHQRFVHEHVQALLERDRITLERDQLLGQHDLALNERDQASQERDQALETLERSSGELRQVLTDYDQSLQSHDRAMSELNQILLERDQRLQSQEQNSNQLEPITLERDRAILERDRAIQNHDAMLNDQNEDSDHLKALIMALPIMVFSLDAMGKFVLCEGQGFERLNLDTNALIGQSIFAVLDRSPNIIRAVRRAMTGETMTNEIDWNGFVFECALSPIFDSGSSSAGPSNSGPNSPDSSNSVSSNSGPSSQPEVIGVKGIAFDITDRRQGAADLNLMRSIFEGADTAILVTEAYLNPPGPGIVFANAKFCEMSGYSFEELKGRTPRMLQGPKTNPGILEQLRSTLQRGDSFEAETTNYRKDGSPYQVQWRIVPIRDESGQVTHFASTQQDVSERKRVAQLLRELARLTGSPSQAGTFSEPVTMSHYDLPSTLEQLEISVRHLQGFNSRTGLSGRLEDLGGTMMLAQMLALCNPTGLLQIEDGRVEIRNGRVTGITHEHLEGDDALLHLLALEAGGFMFDPNAELSLNNLNLGLNQLALDAAFMADDRHAQQHRAQNTTHEPSIEA
jgi:PAS domain S-box-containing protein